MFNAKVSAVKSLMVIGKLLTLLAISNVHASDIQNPQFFEYHSHAFANRLVDVTFGWSKRLSREDLLQYHQSVNHAVNMAENGQEVKWYGNDASGYAVPVVTWPSGNGYCRRVYIQTIAYNMKKTSTATACYDQGEETWRWVNYK
jgi:surface antigen